MVEGALAHRFGVALPERWTLREIKICQQARRRGERARDTRARSGHQVAVVARWLTRGPGR